MKKLFSKLRGAAAAIALSVAAIGVTTIAAPSVAFAQPRDNGMEDPNHLPEFDQFQFVPGREWYRLNVDLPASVVARAEREIGHPFCKIQIAPGQWVSNLKVCPENHPQMSDPVIGALNPRRHRDGGIIDYFVQNYAYDMPTRRSDLPVARAIQAQYTTYLAELEQRRDRERVQLASAEPAAGQPINLLPANFDTVTRNDRPVRTATRTTPRGVQIAARTPVRVPLPVARPPQAEIDRIVAARDAAPAAVVADAGTTPVVADPVAAPVVVASTDPVPAVTTPVADPAPIVVAALDQPTIAVPVHTVRTLRVRQDAAGHVQITPNERPAVVAVVTPAVPQATPVRTAFDTAVTPSIQRVALSTSPLVAANDENIRVANAFATASQSPISRYLRDRATGASVSASPFAPPKRDNNKQTPSDQFAIAANDRFEPQTTRSGGKPRQWVTPTGKDVAFEVFNNGRFRVAPQLMAA